MDPFSRAELVFRESKLTGIWPWGKILIDSSSELHRRVVLCFSACFGSIRRLGTGTVRGQTGWATKDSKSEPLGDQAKKAWHLAGDFPERDESARPREGGVFFCTKKVRCHNGGVLRIVEVGPRDGLQNEPTPIPTEVKARFIRNLVLAGVSEIEATSFVSPKWVPQLGDAAELWPKLPPGPLYSALVPNIKGLERALECGVQRIAVFTAASESFTKKNINMTLQESLDVFKGLVQEFRSKTKNGWVRAYISTAFECPYEGKISPATVSSVVERVAGLGVDEVSLGDTIGVATPKEVRELAQALSLEKGKTAWHFHDTRGTAIANVQAAWELGYEVFDSSAAGLGGCPYAPGAGGNLATEDLVYLMERSGVKTGIDLQKLALASLPVLEALGRRPASRAQQAVLPREPGSA